MLVDAHKRRITYLRLSLTDRCNLRCLYCMPQEGMTWLPPETLMQDDEIVALLTQVFLPLGITRIRLTGGEPLLRKGLPALVRRIAELPGLEDLALSTNGIFLERMSADLAAGGLRRVNVSLDSLDAGRFKEITRGGDLNRVLAGLYKAVDVGLSPVKVNMVVIPGKNDDEILEFAELTRRLPVHVRYIEMMHVGDRAFFDARQFLPVAEIQERLRARHALVAADEVIPGNGPARILRIPGALGTLGFISPMSRNFCETCNRLRLTADGQIKACLMRPQESDLLGCLRAGASAEAMRELVLTSLGFKPEHHEWGAGLPIHRTMSRIGG